MSLNSLVDGFLHSFISALEELPPAAYWQRFAPAGAGFSVESPAPQRPYKVAGLYSFVIENWSMDVLVSPHEETCRRALDRQDREALERELELSMDTTLDVWSARRVGEPSRGTFAGHPTLRFSFTAPEHTGINLLVITGEHLFNVLAIGGRGASTDDAHCFIDSFRLTAPGVAFVS